MYKHQGLEDIDSFAEDDEEVQKIIGALQLRKNNKIENFEKKIEENIPKIFEISYKKPFNLSSSSFESQLQILSPVFQQKNLNLNQLNKIITREQKNLDLLQEENKEIERLITPDLLKHKYREEIEILRKRDLEEIKIIAPETGSEKEIVKIFEDIINRRYEKINRMFDDNIKAVQDALAQSVIKDEKSITETIELRKNLVEIVPENNQDELDFLLKQMIGTQHIREIEEQILRDFNEEDPFSDHQSSEPSDNEIRFPLNPKPVHKPFVCEEPLVAELNPDFYYEDYDSIENFGPNNVSPSNIIWIDEVAVPENIDFADYIIESSIEELYQIIFSEVFDKTFRISAKNISSLSEDILFALLSNEINIIDEELKNSMNDQSILNYAKEVFENCETIIKDLKHESNADPLEILSKMQESEIGSSIVIESLPPLNPNLFYNLIDNDLEQVCIFKKLIFDCINECIDSIGIKPQLPWTDN